MKLARIAPGAYRTADGEWTIDRGVEGSSWRGEWVVQHARIFSIVSDPVPTLREARAVLETMIAARAAGRI